MIAHYPQAAFKSADKQVYRFEVVFLSGVSGGSRICEKGGGGGGNPNSSMPRPKIGQKKTKIGRNKGGGGAAADSPPPPPPRSATGSENAAAVFKRFMEICLNPPILLLWHLYHVQTEIEDTTI